MKLLYIQFKFSRCLLSCIAFASVVVSPLLHASPPVVSSPEDLIRPIGRCDVCPICPPSLPPTLCDPPTICEECEICPICPPSLPPTECPEQPVCPTPTPTPTPTPEPRCEYYQMDFQYVNGMYGRRHSKIKLDHRNAADLGCFAGLVEKTRRAALSKTKGNATRAYTGGGLFSESSTGSRSHNFSRVFSGILWENLRASAGLEGETDGEKARALINCVGGSVIPGHSGDNQIGSAGSKQAGCESGNLFLDSECKLVDKNTVDPNNLCGNIDYHTEIATPVSLVWNEDYADKPATMVNFKLNPHSKDDVWMWRASESLPLLVYDPTHSGSITSASQLFGSWTFGGNGLAALFDSKSVGSPWRDGYDALSVMDKNRDGKVSGEELKDLALWFDRNQDGISQPGEVTALSELGVTALYYEADTKEEGALVATKGYERIVDGKTVVARSMDWSEKSLRNGFDVILDKTDKILSSSMTSFEASTDSAAKNSDSSVVDAIAGVWNWSIDLPANGSGILSFDSTENGVLGTTITQVGLTGMSAAESKVLFAHFEVELEKSKDGLLMVHFTQGGKDGATMINSAILSKDKDKLVGKTIVKNSSLSESGSYEYTWTAERSTD